MAIILFIKNKGYIMLLNFKVKNYKSFQDTIEFSMEATKLKNLKDSNTFSKNNVSILKSAIIYGANASGKSNLLNAMTAMKDIVKFSTDIEKQKHYRHHPFLLNCDSEQEPTMFEISFIIDELLYIYGFEINPNSEINSEWLYQKKLKKYAQKTELFIRNNKEINIGASFGEGKGIFDKTRKNALFLSVVAQFNGKISQEILDWFDIFNIVSNIDNEDYKYYSFSKLDDNEFKDKIVSFVKSADTGITGIHRSHVDFSKIQEQLKEDGIDDLPEELVSNLKEKGLETIETTHMQYDNEKNFTQLKTFNINFESVGTQKLLALSGPIIEVLENGEILIIDELDNSMHTDLVEAIIKLFNSSETNPKNAQLIFTTHDTNLLNQELYRRDQIWFTEKNIYGASDLYSLIEYGKGKIRDDLALEKNYRDGKFGGKPHITSLVYEVD